MADDYTLGIEEEYIIVDGETYDAVDSPPKAFMRECRDALGKRVTPEFLRCQVEIGTPVCESLREARHHLVALRRSIVNAAEKHGMHIIASSTHPFAKWMAQHPTQLKRYRELDQDLKGAIRRLLICGMHVHIGIPQEDLRIDIMNQAKYFLPHLLALSCSSPFWGGQNMGLKSYRLAVFDGMPRTGMPDDFDSYGQYQRVIGRLIQTGRMQDASKIWWDLRPSARYPTIEMRVTDVCPRLEDALCIAALFRCVVRYLVNLRNSNRRWRVYPRILLNENRWLAQRHGTSGDMLDLGRTETVPFCSLIEELIDILHEDAQALGCLNEILHARTIIERGSSASRQLDVYEQSLEAGDSEEEALRAVVRDLVAETKADLGYAETRSAAVEAD